MSKTSLVRRVGKNFQRFQECLLQGFEKNVLISDLKMFPIDTVRVDLTAYWWSVCVVEWMQSSPTIQLGSGSISEQLVSTQP